MITYRGVSSIVVKQNPISTIPFNDTWPKGTWLDGSYEHEIRSWGGFWSSRFTLLPVTGRRMRILRDYLFNGLGREVTVFTPESQVAWNGIIYAMTLNADGDQTRVSLEDLANRVWVRYGTGASTGPQRSNVYSNQASQARYGIKELVVGGDQIASAALANQAAQVALAGRAFQVSSGETGSLNAGAVGLAVECIGFSRTLNWTHYNSTAGSTKNAHLVIGDILNDPIVGQFIRSFVVMPGSENTTQIPNAWDRDYTAWNIIQKILAQGDSNFYNYAFGVYEDRIARYARQPEGMLSNIEYFRRISDGRKMIYDQSGQVVNPALMRPNKWIRKTDLNPAQSQAAGDFESRLDVSLVQVVNYKEPLGVSWSATKGGRLETAIKRITGTPVV